MQTARICVRVPTRLIHAMDHEERTWSRTKHMFEICLMLTLECFII